MSKSLFSVLLILLSIMAFSPLTGCSSGVNSQNSVTSGTTTGFGGSGGVATQVSVVAGNTQIASGGTTPITIIITDAQGRRTNASIIVTSSQGGTFGGTSSTTLSDFTVGGSLTTTFTAPAIITTATGPSSIETEITAFIIGTTVKGSAFITITPNT